MQSHNVPRHSVWILGPAIVFLVFAGSAWADEVPSPPPPPLPPPVTTAPVDAEAGSAAAAEDFTSADTSPAATADGPGPILDDVAVQSMAPRRLRRRLPLHGSFRAQYRLRETGNDSDSDLYQYLLVHAGDENCPGWSGSFHGRLAQDLDGGGDAGQFFVFDSVDDTYDSWLTGRVYHAYVNYRPRRGILRQARLGRQFVEAGELLHMDGLSLDLQPGGGRRSVEVMAFGGLPAHLFESSIDGEFLAGVRVKARPWRNGELELDYAHIEDDSNYYGEEINDLFSLAWRQRVSSFVGFWAQYQHLNGDPRQFRLNFDATDPVRDVFVQGSVFTLLETQNAQTYSLDPYFVIARQLEPYVDAHLAVSKGFGNHLFLEGGFTLRQLYDNGDEGRYNREYERYFLGVSTDDWPWRNTMLSLVLERWDSRDDATTVGFEAEWKPSRRFRLQLGTDYESYRFDLYTADERQSSRGYYVRVRYRPYECLSLHMRLRVEEDAFDTYVTLRTGFDLDF